MANKDYYGILGVTKVLLMMKLKEHIENLQKNITLMLIRIIKQKQKLNLKKLAKHMKYYLINKKEVIMIISEIQTDHNLVEVKEDTIHMVVQDLEDQDLKDSDSMTLDLEVLVIYFLQLLVEVLDLEDVMVLEKVLI